MFSLFKCCLNTLKVFLQKILKDDLYIVRLTRVLSANYIARLLNLDFNVFIVKAMGIKSVTF